MMFEFIDDIESSTFFNILENISTKSPSPSISEMVSAFFCAVNNTGDIKNLRKFCIFPVILKAQKRQTIFRKSQE